MDELQRKSLAQQVAERLIQRIAQGIFKPGERLPSERDLSSALKVTRTTIREAIKILQGLRLVTVRHGDGARVQDLLRSVSLEVLGELIFMEGDLNIDALDQIMEARSLYGKVVASLAAQRRSQDDLKQYADLLKQAQGLTGPALQRMDMELFHALAMASRNMVFLFVLNAISSIYQRHEAVFSPAYADAQALLNAHKGVLKAMQAQDPETAGQAMLALLEKQRKLLMEVYNGQKDKQET